MTLPAISIGDPIIRGRWGVLAGWLAAVIALGVWVSPIDPAANEQTSFLPDRTPYSQATRALQEAFPHNSGLSEAVVVFERVDGPLGKADLQAIEQIAGRIRQPSALADRDALAGMTVRSPASIRLNDNPLISPAGDRGQAALISVSIPANFITLRSAGIVDHISSVLQAASLPDGLSVAVTGSSGFGRDYAAAANASHRKTLFVTLAAVIGILLLVYRAPIAAFIPLVAISLAAFVAMRVLALTQHFGMHVGTAENIFVIVLLYGAGTDYSLFFLSRFREFLEEGRSGPDASARALDMTFPAIFASAGTDTAGLLMLCFADYGVFKTTGPAVAIALAVAMVAAVTLVPVAAAVAGRAVFWPVRIGARNKLLDLGRKKIWPNLARLVTARPGWVLAVVAIVLLLPALQGTRLRWVYDTLTAVKPNPADPVGNAAVGLAAAKRHWPVGQIAPVHVLIRSGAPLEEAAWRRLAARATKAAGGLDCVKSVRSLTQPLGRPLTGIKGALIQTAGWSKIRSEYISEDGRSMRLAVILNSPAFSLEAMDTVAKLRSAIETVSAETKSCEIFLAGATAEMMDIRTITKADFRRVAVLSLTVIFVMVLLLVRDWILSAAMVASTVLSYLATLGISYWVFAGLGGQAGLDWKVEVFLFVVMVAVGVDYNIFLASRLAQEAKRLPLKLAVARAVIHTGPVISSCGVIMAATLGSLMAGDLTLLHQLGFALALGMLIDTFLVRPLLLPAFVVLTRRTGRAISLGH